MPLFSILFPPTLDIQERAIKRTRETSGESKGVIQLTVRQPGISLFNFHKDYWLPNVCSQVQENHNFISAEALV